jgi:hypothetical protein
VRTTQHLGRLVQGAAAGTTFWLEPGVHVLGRNQYDQVIPKDGMTFIGAPRAVFDGRRRNLYAFTGQASGVTIKHLTIRRFGVREGNFNEGVVNHDTGDGWRVLHNTIRGNAGAGLYLGSRNVVAHNCIKRNGQQGFGVYQRQGVRDVVVRHNEIVGNNTDDWENLVELCGCSGGGKFWDTRDARVIDNWIHDNDGVGLWVDTNNTGFSIRGNHISENTSVGLIYEISYNARIESNTFVRNALVEGPSDPGFPIPALYISESGSDTRAGALHGDRFVVRGNRFVDNWAGIMAWEHPARFAGSPGNSSEGYTTLVNPEVATERACSDPDLLATDPYVDDCRWKTQNLLIEHNTFRFDPSRIGRSCTRANGCGFMGLVSQWGSYPEWSPYMGDLVPQAITFHQGNVWRANRYVGPWRFQIKDLGNVVPWSEWRSSPYGQDLGSTWTE